MMEPGSPNAATMSKDECISACLSHQTCQSVDYSPTEPLGRFCQFHYSETQCGVLIPDAKYTHFSLSNCSKCTNITADISI